MFQNYYNNESDTFKIVCPFFLIERKFLIEKHNNKDYGTGIISIMEKLGYTFDKAKFSEKFSKEGETRKRSPNILMSFKDTRRGPAIDIPLAVREDNPKLPLFLDMSCSIEVEYKDFRKAKNY